MQHALGEISSDFVRAKPVRAAGERYGAPRWVSWASNIVLSQRVVAKCAPYHR